MMGKYEWKISVKKGIIQLLVFGIPLLVTYYLNFHPEISTLTIGTVLTALLNWAKNRNN